MHPRRHALLAFYPALYAALRPTRRDLTPSFHSSKLLLIHKARAEYVPALPALCLVRPSALLPALL